ncbi:radical SAM protein [Streptomyces sp. 769]|uniref:radical SAM/SPASM domain-containing protein n=1 Tax=Streptomyces sp. 769 TaxID=1262452 RepID=UPI000581F020|nr:radical SAM protein [Streptomyces sp. 769]AJC54963.1 radical SAM domain-containing protein [Streptomyces sp. 769]
MHRTNEQHDPIARLYCGLDAEDTGSAVSVILKLRGETCDIDCLYCYEKRKEAPGGARIDAGQVRRLAELFQGRPLSVELHGGEPLTAGRDHIADVLRELSAQPTVVRVSMQTNGVLLDDQWLDLFDALYPDLQIGISLDGDAAGNTWRIGYDGRPVYPRVAAALRLLAARGRKTGVIAAVTPAVLGRAEAVLDHLADFEAVNAVSFVPCFDASVQRSTAAQGRRLPASRLLQDAAVRGPQGPSWAISPAEYAQFVLAATVRWIGAGHSARLKLEPTVSTIRRLRGLDTGFCHFSNMKCDHVFTLYPDGRLGSCDELPWPQAQLGHLDRIPEEAVVIAGQRRLPLLNQGKALMERCTSCGYRSTCGGGCVATRWRQDQAGDQDAYCDYRMRMIDGIAALVAQPAHPAGAWCRTVHWRPRTPNSMRDVAAFLARWGRADAPRTSVRLHTSAHGNINTVGLPGVHEADDLDPAHPQWREAIEPGVRPLVDAVTRSWGLVTYDSCQGHLYSGLDLPPVERRVGLLPRDRTEYAQAAAALCRVVTAAVSDLPASVQVSVGRADLTCEATGRTTPVLDLALHPAPGHDWHAYFDAVDAATRVVAGVLRGERPAEGGCSCPVPQAATPAVEEVPAWPVPPTR